MPKLHPNYFCCRLYPLLGGARMQKAAELPGSGWTGPLAGGSECGQGPSLMVNLERPSGRTLTLLFSSEEVILAEDETDVEQRHPFDGNCSEPSMKAGPGGVGLAGAGHG